MLGTSNAIDIGFRLKEVRSVLKLSRSNLAEIVLISGSHLANIENGNRDINVGLLIELYDKFKVSSDYLLFGKGSMFINDEDHAFNIYNMSNSDKIEMLLQLYHYFANAKDDN